MTTPGRDVFGLAGLAQTFALLLGVLAVTSEFRHGTITSSLLITPQRSRLLVAKLVNLIRAGLVLGLLAFAGAAAIVLPVLSTRGVASLVDTGEVIRIVAGGTIATALFAALGLGIGTVVRNQVGAIIAALSLLYVLEPLLTFIPAVGDAVQRFGLGGLSSGASDTTGFQSDVGLLGQTPALLVLAAYAVTSLVLSSAILRRRDVVA
jgi:ABC-2 type transport system permease protein